MHGMIKTKGLFHIGLPVNDPDRAKKFYTEVLGMEFVSLQRDDMGDGLARVELRSGDDIIVLFERPKAVESDSFQEDGATHQAFIVDSDDFELASKKMGEWGVRIHHVPTVDRGAAGRGFYFFDTEGNLLQLYTPPR
jgi:catechol 2,3-dioxygenase-like lactoylglutathione lyase family enzyme